MEMRGVCGNSSSSSNREALLYGGQFWAKGRQAALGKFGIVRVEPTGSVQTREITKQQSDQQQQQSQQFFTAAHSHIKKQEMFKVPSLLFDLETEDVGNSISACQTEMQLQVNRELSPKTVSELQVTESIASIVEDVVDKMSLADLVVYLETKGIEVKLRNALGGSAGSECLRQLRHSFLLYSTRDGVDYIIDPTFKSQFEVAHPTKQYQAVLDALPSLYIASEDSLVSLVHFLCKQMEKSFQERGEIIPPWRSRSAVLSMWKPRRSTDFTPRQISNNLDTKNSPETNKIALKIFENIENNIMDSSNKYNNMNNSSNKSDFFIPIGDEQFPKESLVTGSGDSGRSILSEVLQGDSESSSPQGVDLKAPERGSNVPWIQVLSAGGINNNNKSASGESEGKKFKINNVVPLKSCLSSQLAAQN
eukprot:TRINITY_DN27144_c0_g1_i2.p1 TRINITY_DN27144_c0_g1~~TRINITY_DN27144_c0_g1_i2.p1  ORF type:complete len:421 (-),score=87.20 TRINITY_DN27144_c0_g1_i2:192-1454(-)